MALTALQRKHRQLEREEAERRKRPDATRIYAHAPFYSWIDDNPDWMNVAMALDAAGLQAPSWRKDDGPRSASGELEQYGTFEGYEGAIGRAEVMVDSLLDASLQLAQLINDYKQEGLERRLELLRKSQSVDEATRRLELEEAVHIARVLDHLKKKVRRDFPQWKAKL